MKKIVKAGILGCGDFLRWQANLIKATDRLEIKYLFDPRRECAEKFAGELGGTAVDSDDIIFNDPGIDIVILFVPPWIRRGLIERACNAGKHIYTTKPLGPTIEECTAMRDAVKNSGVLCGLGYNRTANPLFETYKTIFADPEIGKLILYRQDWIHHYPEWNNWALDPERNGGPFMDAMIHNLNIARYLMGRPLQSVTYFSDKLKHTELKCGDTEAMKVDFDGHGAAYLFITWAADLAVYSKDGNDREHIDICYMVSEQGWRLTHSRETGKLVITASRGEEKRTWNVNPLTENAYQQFIAAIDTGTKLPADIPDVQEGLEDITIIRTAEKNPGTKTEIKF